MSKVLISESILTDIADSIREKTEESGQISVSDFSDKIDSIETGGGVDINQTINYTCRDVGGNAEAGNNVMKHFYNGPLVCTVTSGCNRLEAAFKASGFNPITFTNNCNASNVQSIDYLLSGNNNITEIDLRPLGLLSRITSMSSVFYYCANLRSVNMTGIIDTSKLTLFSSIFAKCYYLTSIEGINTSMEKVTSFSSCFSDCNNLERLDLSNWSPTGTGLNTASMFYFCRKLNHLDMRNFPFINIGSASYQYNNMFSYIPNNCLIIVKDNDNKNWITSRYSSLTNVKTVAEYEASLQE